MNRACELTEGKRTKAFYSKAPPSWTREAVQQPSKTNLATTKGVSEIKAPFICYRIWAEPADKNRTAEVYKTSNNWKIAGYISFAFIVALIVLNIIPSSDRSGPSEILDKSIEVLPFYIRYFAL